MTTGGAVGYLLCLSLCPLTAHLGAECCHIGVARRESEGNGGTKVWGRYKEGIRMRSLRGKLLLSAGRLQKTVLEDCENFTPGLVLHFKFVKVILISSPRLGN